MKITREFSGDFAFRCGDLGGRIEEKLPAELVLIILLSKFCIHSLKSPFALVFHWGKC